MIIVKLRVFCSGFVIKTGTLFTVYIMDIEDDLY